MKNILKKLLIKTGLTKFCPRCYGEMEEHGWYGDLRCNHCFKHYREEHIANARKKI